MVQGLHPFYYIDATALLSHIAVSFCESFKVLVVLKIAYILYTLTPLTCPLICIQILKCIAQRKVKIEV